MTTNKQPIRAQWGVQQADWLPPFVNAPKATAVLLYTRPDGAQVLPPLGSKPEPKLDATEGNCSESPNSSPIVAEVGMEVVYRNSKGAIFNGTIRKITRSQSCLEVAMLEGGTLAFDWGGDGWLFHAYPAIITCAKTGRPVVLPNCQGLLNSCDESEPTLPDHAESLSDKIVVGSQWRRNSDGRQCVVVARNGDDVDFQIEKYEGTDSSWPLRANKPEHFTDNFTYLFTPARDLSNVEDGWKIVGFDGEVVAHTIDSAGQRRLKDANGLLHSVNGLPSSVWRNGNMFWFDHGKSSCLAGPSHRYATGDEYFCIDDKHLSPTEWADRRVADRATPDDVEEPWRHLIVEAQGRAKPKGERYTVELREGKRFKAWLIHDCYELKSGVAKFYNAGLAEKVAKLLNESLAAKEAGDE